MENQKFGAGIWHFATYVDRYATDGYGEPAGVLEAIDLAGQVGPVGRRPQLPLLRGGIHPRRGQGALERTGSPSSASRPRCTRENSPRVPSPTRTPAYAAVRMS